MELPSVFDRYRAEIDTVMRTVFEGRRLPLYDMLQYHLGWINERGNKVPNSGGKAFRPTLCLLACDAVSSSHHQAVVAAVATELVHNFSLIHDDIQDNDRERRHRPTVWCLWGKPQAINAGSAMLVMASLALFRLTNGAVSAPKQLQVARLLDESCLEMIEGQYLDISYESRLDITVSEYLEMIDKKTAALISTALEIGALLGADDESIAASFRRFGRKLGAAFQIRDDILGIWGDEKLTGKPQATDIRHKKKSLPVIYGLEQAEDGAKKEMLAIYGKKVLSDNDIASVLTTLTKLGAQAYAQSLARELQRQALLEIQGLPLTARSRQDFNEMASFLVEREF